MGRQMMGNMMQDMGVSQLCVLPMVHSPILTRFTWTGCVEGPGVQAAPNPEPGEAPSPLQPMNTAGFALNVNSYELKWPFVTAQLRHAAAP